MPDWRAILGPLGPGSVSIGTQPSSRSGAARPSRERTKARIGAATAPSRPCAGERVAQRLAHEAEPAGRVVVGEAPGADRPARARRIVVAQVLADARQGVAHLDAELLQALRLADARQLEQLRGVDRAGAHHDLARGAGLARSAAHRIAHPDAALAFEQESTRSSAPVSMRRLRALADRVEIAARRAHAPAARRSSPGSWRCRPGGRRCSRGCARCRPRPPP